MIDIFAWIVLIILVASGIAVFFMAARFRAHCQKPRASLGAGGHRRRLGDAVLGFALWPVAVIWAYVDIPARKGEAAR